MSGETRRPRLGCTSYIVETACAFALVMTPALFMSHNTFGHLFRVTTWGESHGDAIGCVVDGCPPGIAITAEEIQVFLDKRRPGQSRFTTQRKEPDAVEILSGMFPERGRPSSDAPARRSRS